MMKSILTGNKSLAMYDSETKEGLILVTKYVKPGQITLPKDIDEMVEDAQGNKQLKYPWTVSVQVGGFTYMKADRDAVREFFPQIAPKPRASNYREK